MEDKKMLRLKKSFQKKLFEDVILKYRNSSNAEKFLGIPASSIRAYKNLYFKTISEDLIKRLFSLGFIEDRILKENIIENLKKSEIIKKSLRKGSYSTKKKFQKIRDKIPGIKQIVSRNELDFLKWFNEYIHLINFGLRKFNIEEKDKFIVAEYNNFTKKGNKIFKRKLPKKFVFDDDFSYFFGLWCGDRSGGKRFGVVNKDKFLLEFSEKFLIKNFQDVEKIFYCHKNSEKPEIKFDKKFVIKNSKGGWAISVHANNGILTSFFMYLLDNLDFLLENCLNQNAFFAGLFDAEGNVSLYNKSFRWACKNKKLISIYKKYLTKMNLYKYYDGGCLVSDNRKSFKELILYYLKHSNKKNDALFLCTGNKNFIPKNINDVLNHIQKISLKNQKDLAKALKKSKVYSELSLLEEFGFIVSEGHPKRFKLNKEIKNISGD